MTTTSRLSLIQTQRLASDYSRKAREANHAEQWPSARRYDILASQFERAYSERLGALLLAATR
jgi:hypothetical protein